MNRSRLLRAAAALAVSATAAVIIAPTASAAPPTDPAAAVRDFSVVATPVTADPHLDATAMLGVEFDGDRSILRLLYPVPPTDEGQADDVVLLSLWDYIAPYVQ